VTSSIQLAGFTPGLMGCTPLREHRAQ
jgi:hypothetical protein